MNDKTIIRPGGRRPKRGASDPDSAADDDKTQVRSSQHGRADDESEDRPKAAESADSPDFTDDSSDKTMVRPGGSGRKRSSTEKPPVESSPSQATETPADDRTQVRLPTRKSDSQTPPEPERNVEKPTASREPAVAQDADDGDDKTMVRSPVKRQSQQSSERALLPDDDRTKVRPAMRKNSPNLPEELASTEKTSLTKPPSEDQSGADIEDKTMIRPAGRRPIDASPKVDSLPDDDRTQVRSSSRGASKEPRSEGLSPTGPDLDDGSDRTMIRPGGRPPKAVSPGVDSLPDDDRTFVRSPGESNPAQDNEVADISAELSELFDSVVADIDHDEGRAASEDEVRGVEALDDKTMVRSERGQQYSTNAAEDNAAEDEDDDDRTHVRPSDSKTDQGLIAESGMRATDARILSGDETITGLITPLLTVIGKLQSVEHHPNISDFREYAIERLEAYQALDFGFRDDADVETIAKHCSFALCALIDDVVLSTPWGFSSDWSKKPLVDVFHADVSSDEHFFARLSGLMDASAPNLPALEVFYLCLELGYEGKYREEAGGGRAVDALRNKLYALISEIREPSTGRLSNRWEGAVEEKNTILKQIPYWVILSVAIGCIVSGYVGFSLLLSNKSDATRRALAEISMRGPVEIALASTAAVAPTTRGLEPDLVKNDIASVQLEAALSQELSAGYVEIVEQDDKTILRLSHPDMFLSGSHKVSGEFVPLIESISSLLNDISNRIIITGHTDDVPVRSLKYSSNWEISKLRADSMKEIMVAKADFRNRLRTQGLADTVNLVPNDSEENRASNRRVEIVVFK